MPQPLLVPKTLTIPISTTNGAVDLDGGLLVGVQFPAVLTGTTITITGSAGDADLTPTYGTIQDTAGAAIAVLTYSASAFRALDPTIFAGLRSVKFTSNGTEAAERVFTLMVRN